MKITGIFYCVAVMSAFVQLSICIPTRDKGKSESVAEVNPQNLKKIFQPLKASGDSDQMASFIDNILQGYFTEPESKNQTEIINSEDDYIFSDESIPISDPLGDWRQKDIPKKPIEPKNDDNNLQTFTNKVLSIISSTGDDIIGKLERPALEKIGKPVEKRQEHKRKQQHSIKKQQKQKMRPSTREQGKPSADKADSDDQGPKAKLTSVLEELNYLKNAYNIEDAAELDQMFFKLVDMHRKAGKRKAGKDGTESADPKAVDVYLERDYYYDYDYDKYDKYEQNDSYEHDDKYGHSNVNKYYPLGKPELVIDFPFDDRFLALKAVAGATALGAVALGAAIATPFLHSDHSNNKHGNWLDSLKFWKDDSYVDDHLSGYEIISNETKYYDWAKKHNKNKKSWLDNLAFWKKDPDVYNGFAVEDPTTEPEFYKPYYRPSKTADENHYYSYYPAPQHDYQTNDNYYSWDNNDYRRPQYSPNDQYFAIKPISSTRGGSQYSRDSSSEDVYRDPNLSTYDADHTNYYATAYSKSSLDTPQQHSYADSADQSPDIRLRGQFGSGTRGLRPDGSQLRSQWRRMGIEGDVTPERMAGNEELSGELTSAVRDYNQESHPSKSVPSIYSEWNNQDDYENNEPILDAQLPLEDSVGQRAGPQFGDKLNKRQYPQRAKVFERPTPVRSNLHKKRSLKKTRKTEPEDETEDEQ